MGGTVFAEMARPSLLCSVRLSGGLHVDGTLVDGGLPRGEGIDE